MNCKVCSFDAETGLPFPRYSCYRIFSVFYTDYPGFYPATKEWLFVCVFGAFFGRVFRGRKICALYFKICLTYFKICRTYFFFAPMWVKNAENQFSLFGTKNALFKVLIAPSRNVCFLTFCTTTNTGKIMRTYIIQCRQYRICTCLPP